MTFGDSYVRQKRETEQSRMPEPLQAYWESIFPRDEYAQAAFVCYES